MIDAGIVGLGWWGNRLVEAVQGKSDRIRFVHGVARDPAAKQEIARRHGLVLSPTLAAMLAILPCRRSCWRRRTPCTAPRSRPWRRPASRCSARSR